MKKLDLKAEDLRVESFDAQPENEQRRGTVKGAEATGFNCSAACPTAVGCPPTQCTCGMDPGFRNLDGISYCQCCV
jgi:hypothetical protein